MKNTILNIYYMKNIYKVIEDRKAKIESNNLKIVEYVSHEEIKCKCTKCGYDIIDNHLNLCKNKFKCRYCILTDKSSLIKDGLISIIKIDEYGDGAYIYLRCNNGHTYKQDRRNLLANKGCNQCYLENKRFTLDDVLFKFNKKHGDYYSYNMSSYKNLHSKIKITCKRGHIFYQKVSNHIQGKGCPNCRESLGERTISKYLCDNNIIYERQKKFKDCKYVNMLPFDFYIPDLNMVIEFDGIQHFKPIKQFGGEKEFEKVKIKDKIKSEYCENNSIHLLRISYEDNIQKKLDVIKEHIIF